MQNEQFLNENVVQEPVCWQERTKGSGRLTTMKILTKNKSWDSELTVSTSTSWHILQYLE